MAKNREISQTDFEKLLNWLNADKELAGRKYEAIRLRLIKVFTLRGCHTADELADITIDKVIEKIDSIVENYDGDPVLYFYGVGKKVFSEFLKTQKPETLGRQISQKNNDEDENTLQKHECLEGCLKKITKENSELIIAYYQDAKQAKIERRRDLANQTGDSSSRLRLRIYRIKNTLEKCVRECVESNK